MFSFFGNHQKIKVNVLLDIQAVICKSKTDPQSLLFSNLNSSFCLYRMSMFSSFQYLQRVDATSYKVSLQSH